MEGKNEKNGKKKINGKTEKALHKMIALNEIRKVKDKLVAVRDGLENIIKTTFNVGDGGDDNSLNQGWIGNNKQRCMIEIAPRRIEFNCVHLKFYVDFTFIQETDESLNMKGCFIYGASRSSCFTECICTDESGTSCQCCERVPRCDALEDKPLIQFFIDKHGMIQSSGDFEDSWWIEKEDDLYELHLRTMELIWPKALAWMNENILA